MKKLSFLALAMTMALAGVFAQNPFKGIVKYKVESTGFQIPAEAASAEVKVSGAKLHTKSPIFLSSSPMAEEIIVDGLTTYMCMNFSQLIGYLRSNGSEFTYQGDGKLLVKSTGKRDELDSLSIEDKEPGHFYYEYVGGESKEIAGVKALKVVMHSYDAEGEDHPVVMWYSPEIGPEYNLLFSGVKGMPLQCTMNVGEGRTVTYTATEIVSGKVKDVDFLIPDGYKSLSDEEMSTLMQEIQEELELLQAE